MPPLSDDQQLSALFEQANSPAWSVRAAAGRQLAAAPRTDQAVEVLFRLLLDPDDTAVTRETAQALLERGDTSALRQVLLALARATSEVTMDWLAGTVHDYYARARAAGEGEGRLIRQLHELANDPDMNIRQEAIAMLADLSPKQT
ncbi:HEAT repeat domain-containing protein [Streptomyces sp. enrichment culture]|uniref:HEAT repeat domain-containing protein n=1 Tax=Streptomyces sp. enrichment culture TaxID=1795815 RepID=UPI003F560113